MEIKYTKAFGYVESEKPRFSTDTLPKKEEKKSINNNTVVTTENIIPDFSNIGNASLTLHSTPEPESKPKRKRKTSTPTPVTEIEGDNNQSNLDEEPYSKKYEETTAALNLAIAQIDTSLRDLQTDVSAIRSSRTLKSKYTSLANLEQTKAQYINSKITAIKEINNSISKCNELEMKRRKEFMAASAEQNSDKNIMDMYNAFISMPTGIDGMSANPLGPTVSQLTMNDGMSGVVTSGGINDDAGMQNYLNSMNPAQRLSLYENDPNVQQVVVYDNATGAKRFEVMNIMTGEVIPNVDKRDMMFMEDVVLDLTTGVATNINLNETYPIIEVGQKISDLY